MNAVSTSIFFFFSFFHHHHHHHHLFLQGPSYFNGFKSPLPPSYQYQAPHRPTSSTALPRHRSPSNSTPVPSVYQPLVVAPHHFSPLSPAPPVFPNFDFENGLGGRPFADVAPPTREEFELARQHREQSETATAGGSTSSQRGSDHDDGNSVQVQSRAVAQIGAVVSIGDDDGVHPFVLSSCSAWFAVKESRTRFVISLWVDS